MINQMVLFAVTNEEDDPPPDDNLEEGYLETDRNDEPESDSAISFCYDNGRKLETELDAAIIYDSQFLSDEICSEIIELEEPILQIETLDYNQLLVGYLFGDLTEASELEIINEDDEDITKLEKILRGLMEKNTILANSRNYFQTIGYNPNIN